MASIKAATEQQAAQTSAPYEHQDIVQGHGEDRASFHKHSERASTDTVAPHPVRWRDDDEYAQVEDSTNDGVTQHNHNYQGDFISSCPACMQKLRAAAKAEIKDFCDAIDSGAIDQYLHLIETAILRRRAQLHASDL